MNIKLRILKDHEASPDGIRLNSYKAGEILEVGSSKLPLYLYEWYSQNEGYAELEKESEPKIKEKAVTNSPENKMLKHNVFNKGKKVKEEPKIEEKEENKEPEVTNIKQSKPEVENV